MAADAPLVPEPRPELRALRPALHGGGAPAGVADFSTGVSPLPPPGEILDAARSADLGRYPHPTALPFRAAAAALHGGAPDEIVAGAGSVELIWALARAFAGSGRTGLVVTPAFAEYEQALRASGATVITVPTPAPGLDNDSAGRALDDLSRALSTAQPSIAFVCRPSILCPCLTAVTADDLRRLARRAPRTLFVVDEAYQPLGDGVEAIAPGANVVVLRSLTKLFALAGLRVGYLRAAPALGAAVQAALPPWNVSSAAQAAGAVAAHLWPTHAEAVRDRIGALRQSLERDLAAVAGAPAHADGPFLLYRTARGEPADLLTARLLERGALVRSCASFGMPAHVRVGVRGDDENARLVAAWRGIIERP